MSNQSLYTDHSWNPWSGCREVSEACRNCVALRTIRSCQNRDPRIVLPGDMTLPYRLKPFGRVHVCSGSDFFIEEADAWREEAWRVIRGFPRHEYLILTKRPHRIKKGLPKDWGKGYPHVWLGVTAETQKWADVRIPKLLSVPAQKYWVSTMPMLGPVNLEPYLGETKVSFVSTGCEAGGTPRKTEFGWFEALERQCEASGAEFFLVQSRDEEGRLYRMPYYNQATRKRAKGWSQWWPFSLARPSF